MGQDQVGSFALAGQKTNLMTMAIEARLEEICSTLNKDIIPQTFALNGWDETEYPKITYEKLEEIDLEVFSKAVQRIFSVKAIEADRPVMNVIRESVFGVAGKAENEPVNKDELPGDNASRSGDGMAIGTTGNGTSTDPASTDTSTSNSENKG